MLAKNIPQIAAATPCFDKVWYQAIGYPNRASLLIGLLPTLDLEVDQLRLQVHLRPAE